MNYKHDITICLGSSCFSRGNKSVLEIVKTFLKEHNLESEVFFHGDLCGGYCDRGPVLKIDDELYECVTSDNIYDILNAFFETNNQS
ncbi:(2Fe-2S) ferredoxin domain-containing protein [Marinilabiliaceae bacterium JC017]|nr:(2Fe-2S) ferredoxin domain-containing protein [Marinilabiliaceae bacterium JC017]